VIDGEVVSKPKKIAAKSIEPAKQTKKNPNSTKDEAL